MAKKYGPKVKEEVKEAMHEMKQGKLKSAGKSKKKVTNPKQAIAIGLSKARKEGESTDRRGEGQGGRGAHPLPRWDRVVPQGAR